MMPGLHKRTKVAKDILMYYAPGLRLKGEEGTGDGNRHVIVF